MNRTTLAAMLAVVALAGSARAQKSSNNIYIPPDAVNEQDAPGTALVDAFGHFCLHHFPGPARMEDVAPGQVTALPPARVRDFLHDDPGRGWVYKADGGEYVVTVEDPPYHTCAVRRTYATPPRYRMPWLMLTGLWAASEGRGPFQDTPPQTIQRDGMVIEAEGRTLKGAAEDLFLEIKTTYTNGRVEERLARQAIGR